MTSHIRIASFDIGKKNFAFCVERVDVRQLELIRNIPKKQRYHNDGTPTKEFEPVLEELCETGEIELLQNVDLTEGRQASPTTIMVNMNRVLDQYKDVWQTCNTFVIEQQMNFNKIRNPLAVKLAQHCFSYFLFHFAMFKMPIEFPASHKTRVLGAPKNLNKNGRKKWSVNAAMRIALQRKDETTLNDILHRAKQDDVSDVITQLQAYKYLVFVDKTL